MKWLNAVSLGLFLLFSQATGAEEIKIVGTIKKTIRLPSPISMGARNIKRPIIRNKDIKFLHLQLSNKASLQLENSLKNTLKPTVEPSSEFNESSLPTRIDLGMNNVPVLDQGMHGTCVTFATTAAINALLKKGDYVSQLCQLMLGNYLEKVAYTESGWDGSYGSVILNQMSVFGIVSKEKQQLFGCGNEKKYPLLDQEPSSSMSVEDYHRLSESFRKHQIFWTPILTMEQAFTHQSTSESLLKKVKMALTAGDRLVSGILLLDCEQGIAGAVGKYKTAMDTWVLTPEIVRSNTEHNSESGHEIIITGFDDYARAIDNRGRVHRGLLKLRNSWGTDIGDEGDFYMSYDYFKSLAVEVYRISKGNPHLHIA